MYIPGRIYTLDEVEGMFFMPLHPFEGLNHPFEANFDTDYFELVRHDRDRERLILKRKPTFQNIHNDLVEAVEAKRRIQEENNRLHSENNSLRSVANDRKKEIERLNKIIDGLI